MLNEKHLNRINGLIKDTPEQCKDFKGFIMFNELSISLAKELLIQFQYMRDSFEYMYSYPMIVYNNGGLQLETETIDKRYTFECQVHNSGKIICSFYNLHIYETETEDEDDVEMLEFESKSVELAMSWVYLQLILLGEK